MLIKYIRTPKCYKPKMEVTLNGGMRAYLEETGGDPIGVIVSTERGKVDWSLCNPKDRFDKKLGKMIAINRADTYGFDKDSLLSNVPNSIFTEVIKMYDRSTRYFK